jgi:hypothetical protein
MARYSVAQAKLEFERARAGEEAEVASEDGVVLTLAPRLVLTADDPLSPGWPERNVSPPPPGSAIDGVEPVRRMRDEFRF